MAIRVLMKRRVSDDHAEALRGLVDRLRVMALGQPGYIAGETLKRVDRPGTCLVMSKWTSREAWERWFASPERSEVQNRIDALLGSPTEVEIYDYD